MSAVLKESPVAVSFDTGLSTVRAEDRAHPGETAS
jgi:hypothetical protein